MARQVMIPPTFEDTKAEHYRYVFTTGFFGGMNPTGAQIIFHLDRFEPETVTTSHPGSQKLTKINRELQVEVCMTPALFRDLASWLNKHIELYEKTFGPIPTPPEKGKRQKKGPPSGVYT